MATPYYTGFPLMATKDDSQYAFPPCVRDMARADWLRRLDAVLTSPDTQGETLSARLARIQKAHGLDVTGILTADTRLALVARYPGSLGISLVGPYRTPRVFADGCEASLHARFCALIDALHGVQLSLDAAPQILAIRGLIHTNAGFERTPSARDFAQTPYGTRSHLSADKPNYADTTLAVLWNESGSRHVEVFAGVVNPNGVWPQGTAHLCHGQYFYRLGRHRTREASHIDAVRTMASHWPADWITDRTPDSIQYLALESTSNIEVVRSTGDSLDVSPDDVARAEFAIAHRDPTFVDAQTIKINIHTCAFDHASSLGCQNILPGDYARFMGTLVRLRALQFKRYGFALDIPYLLTDASFFDTF